MKTLGIIVITVGFLLAAFSTYNTIREKQHADTEHFEVTPQKSREVNWTPWVGVAVMAFGGVLFYFAGKKAS